MSTPQDDDGRETRLGRAWLGCQSVLLFAIPTWFGVTLLLLQIDHEGRASPAWWALVALGLTAPLVVAPVALGGAVSALAARRERAYRMRYDQMVRDEAVIHDHRWTEADARSARGDAGPGRRDRGADAP